MTQNPPIMYENKSGYTPVSNMFIDCFLADADAPCIKVYLYLLRCLADPVLKEQLSISGMSDALEETEKEIIRALKHWEQKKLLKLTYESGEVSNISVEPLGVNAPEKQPSKKTYPKTVNAPKGSSPAPMSPVKQRYTPEQIEQFRQLDGFTEIAEHIESLMGYPPSNDELQTPVFLFDSLKLPSQVINYLFDYSYRRNIKSPAYIEKMALDWAAKGVNSLETARRIIPGFSPEYNAVCSSLGLTQLRNGEAEYVERWLTQYKMSIELIREACSRSLANIGKPRFAYVDSILSKWSKAGVRSLEDVAFLDASHEQSKGNQ